MTNNKIIVLIILIISLLQINTQAQEQISYTEYDIKLRDTTLTYNRIEIEFYYSREIDEVFQDLITTQQEMSDKYNINNIAKRTGKYTRFRLRKKYIHDGFHSFTIYSEQSNCLYTLVFKNSKITTSKMRCFYNEL